MIVLRIEINFELDRTLLNDTEFWKMDPNFKNLKIQKMSKFTVFLNFRFQGTVYNCLWKIPNEPIVGENSDVNDIGW